MAKTFLRAALAWESRAYGFTIAFWGSGALLIKEFGLPTLLEALSYGGGAIIGFFLLTLYAYHGALKPVEYEEPQHLILSMVHYLAALFPIIATFYATGLDSPYAFIVAGMSVSIIYNLGMMAEESLSEEAEKLEKWFR